jgi:glyoxylase-like metal-dependent hydrolase (beta-lactamase superfamily II)
MRELFFLSCGTFEVPAFLVEPPGRRSGRRQLCLTIAVGVRDNDDVLLVDAGFSRVTCHDPQRAIGRLRTAVLGLKLTPADAAASQLRALGIDPLRVKTIVATHLHLDHIGGVIDFPEAELVCSQVELSAFHRHRHALAYRAEDLPESSRVRAVALEGGGRLGFAASHDLFGDGEVILLQAPGHSPGHLAVALAGPHRIYVHTGDAADQVWEYGLEPPGPSVQGRLLAWRTSELRRTYACLRACAADPGDPILVPSHDLAVFDALPQRPAQPS